MIPALLKATALTVACLAFCTRHIDASNESDDNIVGDNPAVWGPRSYDKFASHESYESEDYSFSDDYLVYHPSVGGRSSDEIVKIGGRSFDGKGVRVADFKKGIIAHDDIMFRHGFVKSPKKWPSNVIPIQSYFHRNFTAKIFGWLKSVEEHSCVKIVRHKNEKNYISFTNIALPNFSELGLQGGEQVINFNKGQSKGLALHLFMHSLGFWHEHSRVDRNQYVRVVWDNIDPSNRGYFRKHVREVYGQPYDYGSIMHGGPKDFALDDDRNSIVPIAKNASILKSMGQRKDLSIIDFKKLNDMFNCVGPYR